MGQQEDCVVIKGALVIKAANIEQLADFTARSDARLMWHSAITRDVLARRNKMKVSAVFDPHAPTSHRTIPNPGCTAQIGLREYCTAAWIAT